METGKAREIFETLKRDISNGKYDAASPMPSERALMRRFGVARATVASALDELERAGFVYRRRGKTFAAGIETPGHIPQVVAKGDNVRAVRLMQLLQWEPKSPAYLRTTLGIASREYFTKAYLRPLMEAGLIERSDPVHPNSPQQKYALTKDGKRRIGRVAPL